MTADHTGTTGTSYREINALLDRAGRPSAQPVQVTDAQLLALQQRWAVALSARLDEVLESTHPSEGVRAVRDAWTHLAADLRILRGVLDGHQGRSEALDRARSGEYRMLALAAGLARLDSPTADAVRAGQAFAEVIRSGRTLSSAPLAHAG
jgi:hypothetical protein